MPPRKPRQSEPGPAPPAAPKKSRTSLPAVSRSSPKPTSKAAAMENEEQVNQRAQPASKRAKVGAKSPAKKKARIEAGDDDEVESEKEDRLNKPVKAANKSTAKSNTAPKSKTGAAGSSKGEDKISEIYAAGNELLADTSVQKRFNIITTTLDKLEAQLSIPADQIKKLGHVRTTMQTDFSATYDPLVALLKDRGELVSRLNSAVGQYQGLPAKLEEVLLSLDKVQTGAVEAGVRYIEDAQDFSSFTRGTKRFLSWT